MEVLYCHSSTIVVVIMDADRLTKDAQHALRRTMEKYSANLRLILCCSSTSRLISPIKSRCILFRIAGLDDGTMQSILSETSAKENYKLTETTVNAIVSSSHGNMRKAFLMLEATAVKYVKY